MKVFFGYTYLEMIIAIAIIGILAGFGISKYPGVQKTARDSQRKSDLKQYQTSLESYANIKGGFYPSRTAETYASDLNSITPNLCTDLGMSQCALDPKNNKNDCKSGTCNYFYRSNGANDGAANASKYVLYARIEKDTGYWVYCSGGSSGIAPAAADFSLGACPF